MSSASSKTQYLSVADTAKLVRKALKAEFPGQKFSVRSSSYSGGASIRVAWTDGPTQPEVQKVCDLYKGATFDGMTDLKEYRESIVVDENGPQVVHFGADFIFAERTISQRWRDSIGRQIARLADMPCDLSPRGDGWNTQFPVCVNEGRLHRYMGTEYGSTLVHQYAHDRRRYNAPKS